MKPIQRRRIAETDIGAAIAHYLAEAPAAALSFADELQHAYRLIQQFPASGSPRYAHELGVPGLRCTRLRRFPYVVLYVEHPAAIDVWRVLHMHRDIPAWMNDVPPEAPRVSDDVLPWPTNPVENDEGAPAAAHSQGGG